ncbi:MAG: phosphatase PAP2 family protein, partial [Longimicrobiales bacterium]
AAVPAGHGFGAEAHAQSVWRYNKNAYNDMTYIWSAPSRIRADALPEIAGTLAGTGAFMLVDERIYDWLYKHPKSLPGRYLGLFGEDSPLNLIGRSIVLVPTSLGLYTAGWIFDQPALRQAGMGCISANLSTTISRNVLNRLVARLRPRYGKGAFEFQPFLFKGSTWEMRSFPGGHAGHIMSCVSFWSNRFDLGLGEPALYAAALGAGWARVLDGAHWPSDTFFGEVYGWSIGKGIADRYLQRNEDNNARASAGIGVMVRIPF